MKKIIVAVAAVALLGGPLGSVAGANPVQELKNNGVPLSNCQMQALLGVQNVRECEDPTE